jgi:hypothetical protein
VTVWIAQCLCPSRHAILAAVGEADDEQTAGKEIRAPLTETVADMLEDGVINRWCGLCGAKPETWHFEVARTPFATVEEAAPFLALSEARQAVTRAMWGDMKRSD